MLLNLYDEHDAYLFSKWLLPIMEDAKNNGVLPTDMPEYLEQEHGIVMLKGKMSVRVPDGWDTMVALKGIKYR